MNFSDFADSLSSWLKEKRNSSLYMTFVVSVLLWNWEFFYTLFFQSEDKLTKPLIEYVLDSFVYTHGWWYHFFHFFLFPGISSLIVIYCLPQLNNWVFGKTIDFYYDKKKIIDIAELKYQEERIKLINKKTQKTDQEIKALDNLKNKKIEKNTLENKIISESEKWNEEMDLFMKIEKNVNALLLAKEIFYGFQGHYQSGQYNRNQPNYITSDELSILDINSLIEIDTNKEMISLTKKGKYFLGKV